LDRARLDRALDRFRFELDRRPALDYQPLPWLGLPTAARSAGVETRWTAIRDVVTAEGVTSAVDIGCNLGYFTISLAEMGVSTLGIEMFPKTYRMFLYALQKLDIRGAAAMYAELAPDSVWRIPLPTASFSFRSGTTSYGTTGSRWRPRCYARSGLAPGA